MLKICFLADGKSIHTKRWCNFFLEQGFEIHLITFRNEEIPGINVHFVDCGAIAVSGNNKKILLKIPTIRRLIRQIKPDIVHALYATSYGIVGAASKFHPFVVTALGSDVLISPFQNSLYKILLKYVFRKADWITAMSEPMKKVMETIGANAQKTSTVIFGIDPAVFNSKNHKIDPQYFTITSTRNFEEVYNIDVLIKALAIVGSQIPQLRVHLIGAGSQENTIKSLIHNLNLNDIVHIHGRIEQPQIAAYLNQSQLFVSVSSSDGNNISLNEAMACACLSVVSDIPANRQWIEDGVNGFFTEAITPEAIAHSIIQAYHSYDSMIDKTIALNSSLIQEKAIWDTNMLGVKEKYLNLINHAK